jgi:hypothetical protein
MLHCTFLKHLLNLGFHTKNVKPAYILPGRDADHSPPSSAEVKNEQELYLLSPPSASMACSGTALLLIFCIFYHLQMLISVMYNSCSG